MQQVGEMLQATGSNVNSTLTIKAKDAKAKDVKAKDAKVKDAKAKDAKAKDVKAKDAKAKDAKAKDAKAAEAKAREAKAKDAKAREAKDAKAKDAKAKDTEMSMTKDSKAEDTPTRKCPAGQRWISKEEMNLSRSARQICEVFANSAYSTGANSIGDGTLSFCRVKHSANESSVEQKVQCLSNVPKMKQHDIKTIAQVYQVNLMLEIMGKGECFESGCSCNDGSIFQQFKVPHFRRDMRFAANAVIAVLRWATMMVCYTVPRRGCVWKAIGYDPRSLSKRKQLQQPRQHDDPLCLNATARKSRRSRRRRGRFRNGDREYTLREEWGRRRRRKRFFSKAFSTVKNAAKKVDSKVKKGAKGMAKKWGRKLFIKAAKMMLPKIAKLLRKLLIHTTYTESLIKFVQDVFWAWVVDGKGAVAALLKTEMRSWMKATGRTTSRVLPWIQDYVPRMLNKVLSPDTIMGICEKLQEISPAHITNPHEVASTFAMVPNSARDWEMDTGAMDPKRTYKGATKFWQERNSRKLKGAPPEYGEVYLLRAPEAYVNGLFNEHGKIRYLKHVMYEEPESKPAKFITCVSKVIRTKSENTTEDRIRSECVSDAPKEGSAFRKIAIAQKCCISRLVSRIGVCNTCCCKQGGATSNIQHGLIFGGKKCGAWFAAIDVIARTTAGFMRGAWVTYKAIQCKENV